MPQRRRPPRRHQPHEKESKNLRQESHLKLQEAVKRARERTQGEPEEPEAQPEPEPEQPRETSTAPNPMQAKKPERVNKVGGGYVADVALPDGGILRVTRTAGRLTVDVRDPYRRQLLQASTIDTAPDSR